MKVSYTLLLVSIIILLSGCGVSEKAGITQIEVLNFRITSSRSAMADVFVTVEAAPETHSLSFSCRPVIDNEINFKSGFGARLPLFEADQTTQRHGMSEEKPHPISFSKSNIEGYKLDVCCQLTPLKEFTAKTAGTVCVKANP